MTEAARAIHLEMCVSWGKGEEQQKGWDLGGVLGECWEAVFGAAFLDGGLKACQVMYEKVLPYPTTIAEGKLADDVLG